MKKEEDTVLRKDQISSYFERIQPKKDGDDQKKIGFSVGSTTSTTADARGSHRAASLKKFCRDNYPLQRTECEDGMALIRDALVTVPLNRPPDRAALSGRTLCLHEGDDLCERDGEDQTSN